MKPLSRKKRIISLSSLMLIFVIIMPIVIAYSSGYRLDNTFNLVKTGGIYIHSDVSSSYIYLDGEFVEDNGVILRNTLIQDLRPNKTYHVSVEKEEYQSWNRDLKVLPNLVTEAKVLLTPVQTKLEEIENKIVVQTLTTATTTVTSANLEYTNLLDIFENNLDQFEVVVATTTPGVPRVSTTTEINLPDYLLNLKIDDLDKKESLKEKGRIVAWLEDGNVRIVWRGDSGSIPFYFCTETCVDEIVIDWQNEILSYDFLPNRNDVLIVSVRDGIYLTEIDLRSTPNTHTLIERQNLEFKVLNENTIYIKEGQKIFKII